MSVIAEFIVAADEFLLGEILSHDPVAHVEMERVVPTSRRVMPYVWVHGGEFDEFEEAIAASEHVESLTALDRVNGSALYRIEWKEDGDSLVDGITETGASILEARGKVEWFFRIRFPSHAELTEFHDFCRDHGIAVDLERLYTHSDDEDRFTFDLTDAQRTSLLQAVRDGYFEVPRRTTLTEIGEKLGITEQTVSENVRRGADNVLKRVLMEPIEDEFSE